MSAVTLCTLLTPLMHPAPSLVPGACAPLSGAAGGLTVQTLDAS